MINFITQLSITRRLCDTDSIDWNIHDQRLSRSILLELIEECVTIFETATQEIYDRRDWISSSERILGENEPPRNQDISKQPAVLWAYVSFMKVLQVCFI